MNIKFIPVALAMALVLCGCAKEPKVKSEQVVGDVLSHPFKTFSIFDKEFSAIKSTKGQEPSSDFYSTILYTVQTQEDIGTCIKNVIDIGQKDLLNIVVYSSKKHYNDLIIDQNDIFGFGIKYIKDDKIYFSLYRKVDTKYLMVKTMAFDKSHLVRLYEHFKADLTDPVNVSSMIIIYQQKAIKKIDINKSKLGDFNKINYSLEKNLSSGNRSCGCGNCCIVDRCELTSEQGFACQEETNLGTGTIFGCFTCPGESISCIVVGIPQVAFITDGNSNNKNDVINDAHTFRDQFLSEYQKGREYIGYYNMLNRNIGVDNILLQLSNVESAKFVIETLNTAKKLQHGSNNEVIITNDYHARASIMIELFRTNFSNKPISVNILNKIQTDLNKYKNWTKSQIINDIQ